jgi:hypothetical protein
MMIERFQERRLKRAAAKFLRNQVSTQAMEILRDDEKFQSFIDECLAEQSKTFQGPITDLIEKLIQSFIDDPDKWIAIISVIIKLFS